MHSSKSPSLGKPWDSHHILGAVLTAFVVVKIIGLLFAPRPELRASDLTTQNILDAVNRQRSLRNLVVLNTDSRLSSAAQSKADDMQARHYFAHVDPDGNYIWPKIVAAGYSPYVQLGENLAIEFYDTDSLISAWMNSPTHRENLLNEGFKDQGMGLTFGDPAQGGYHSAIANTFGTLLVKKSASSPAPAPSNTSAPSQTKPPVKTQPKTEAPKTPQAPATPPQNPAPATTTPISSPLTATTTKPLLTRDTEAPPSTTPQTTEPAPVTSTPAVNSGSNQNQNKLLGTNFNQEAVVAQNQASFLNYFRGNRYFTLAFGIVLFLYLLIDLQGSDPDSIKVKTKKAGNLAVLFIAILVIALMYWF